jgi:hypothetical protein
MRIFQSSGLDAMNEGVDLYPYFADLLALKKGSEILSPSDPAQYALVLTHIVGELLFGFREIKFYFTPGESDYITPVIESWQKILDDTFYVHYIPRVSEYAHILEQGTERLKTQYAMNLLNDIHWLRRYYILPYYNHKTSIGPSFRKKDIQPLFTVVHELRVILTELAEDIEKMVSGDSAASGNVRSSIGGGGTGVVANAFEPYKFQINNAVSKRMDALLPKKQRTNVSLVFFTLAFCSVLDELLNNPLSTAYSANTNAIFRSVDNNGIEPIFWVEKRTDMDAIFRASAAAAYAANKG